jgi:hypothetical protein
LTSAVGVAESGQAEKLASDAIGYIGSNSSDVQNSATTVALFSSGWSRAHGWSITPDNCRRCLTIFAVRKAIKPTWLNDRDQFTVPASEPDDVFFNDCMVYALFHGSNQTSSLKDVQYKGKTYQVRNHFFPYSPSLFTNCVKSDVGLYRQLERAEPTLIAQHLLAAQTSELSAEAQAVMDLGLQAYTMFFSNLPKIDRKKWKIDYWDAGWYQIRNGLESVPEAQPLLKKIAAAHELLRRKIEPQVYSLGFLQK